MAAESDMDYGMKPAERIPLLKKLAQALADLADWQEIDLVLGEHKISLPLSWDGTLYSYALSTIKACGDEKLLELARYFDPSGQDLASPPVLSDAAGVWKDKQFRLFISHTHANADFAGAIKKRLSRYGIDSFVAHADLKPSVEWLEAIENALLSCQAAVALVTPDFHESQWCDQEIGYCLARRVLVVAVMRGAAPKGFLGRYQAMRIKERDSGTLVAERLFETLATRPETQAAMAPAVIGRFVKSDSFGKARETYALLRQLPKEAWTLALVATAEWAAKDNDQISKAYTSSGKTSIPDQLQKYLAPIREYRISIGDDIPF
jgi:hypothetical protein